MTMPSGWDVYYVVFLSALLALAIPMTLAAISFFVSPQKTKQITPEKVLHEELARSRLADHRVNTRFFLAANAALILMTLILILIPCVGVLHLEENRILVIRG